MTHSTELRNIAKALGKVQRDLQPAKLDGTNANFDSRYPSLAAVWDVARGPLQAAKLTVTQSDAQFNMKDRTVTVETLIMHASGEFIAHTATVPCLATADSVCGEATRLKRRSLVAALGIVAGDERDTDGAHSSWGEAWGDEEARLVTGYGVDGWNVENALRPLSKAQRLVLLRRGLSSDKLIEEAAKMQEVGL